MSDVFPHFKKMISGLHPTPDNVNLVAGARRHSGIVTRSRKGPRSVQYSLLSPHLLRSPLRSARDGKLLPTSTFPSPRRALGFCAPSAFQPVHPLLVGATALRPLSFLLFQPTHTRLPSLLLLFGGNHRFIATRAGDRRDLCSARFARGRARILLRFMPNTNT